MPQTNNSASNGFFAAGGEYHIKMKFLGNKTKVKFFHSTLSDLDRDYPWKPSLDFEPRICADCGGVVYKAPRFKPSQLIAFGKQVNGSSMLPGKLKVKIKRFCTKGQCIETATKERMEKAKQEQSQPVKVVGGPVRPPLKEKVDG